MRRPRTAVPRVLWWVTAAHVVLLFTYSLVVPALRVPDEVLHVERILGLAGLGGPGEVDGAAASDAIQGAASSSPAYTAGAPPVDIGDALAPEDRPTFAELAEASQPEQAAPEQAEPGSAGAPDVPAPVGVPEASPAPGDAAAGDDGADPLGDRPPLASWVGAAVLVAAETVLPGWPWSFDRTVALLRLISVAVVATVPVVAWATARRFGCPPRAALAAAVAVLAVPQLTHVGSVVGSDALVVALGAVVFLLGARIVTGDGSRRTAVLTGVGCGLALLASGSAVVLLAWSVGAYFLAPRRSPVYPSGPGGRLRRGRIVIVVTVATIVGGWWHVGHLLFDQGLALGLEATPSIGLGAGSGLTSRVLADAWGAFGGREAVLASAAVVGATAVLTAALGVAFARGRVRAVRLRLAFLVMPALVLAVLATVAAAISTVFAGALLRVEGRVVLIGLVGLVVVAAVGLDQLRPGPTRALPTLVFVFALVMQLLALSAITARYWAGPSIGERLRTVLAVSPWPPALVFFGTVGAVAVVVWTLVELVRKLREGQPSPAVVATPAP